ncbi:nucleoside hydrolase [Loigolactobacillus jiayinensis]|uniref:Nucleoside hydrolase n=1 Tax=Loigolactobacillus jiayinensis TaxID=2486016 RepID=A0ABW1RGM3_9LACO|nr:nucleoside hydrolase [Loigolactobacillus jiayinensis]
MNAKKVIIDCDPGIDDSLALMLAVASPEFDIIGITIVCGNVPTGLGAENALKILQQAQRLDIPVYLGATQPLKREYVSAQDTHGMDGLGESELPNVTTVRPHVGAIGFLNHTLQANSDVTVIALGPLTNIALALQQEPAAWQHVSEFVSMGGSFHSPGNCSPVAEYNYWCDPDAAQQVYAKMPVPIKMIGLDVTRQIVLTPSLLAYAQRVNPVVGGFIAQITKFYFDFHWQQERVIGCVINDPLAVAYALDPSLCQGFTSYTTVVTDGIALGQSISDTANFWHQPNNSLILTEVAAFRFWQLFLNRVINAQEPELSDILKQLHYTEAQG